MVPVVGFAVACSGGAPESGGGELRLNMHVPKELRGVQTSVRISYKGGH